MAVQAPPAPPKVDQLALMLPGSVLFPYYRQNLAFTPTSIIVQNQTAALIGISDGPSGQIYPIGQYTNITLPWTGGPNLLIANLSPLQVILTTDYLSIIGSDQWISASFSQSGPLGAVWGTGAVPNSLAAITQGNGFFAWQVQQFVNLLTGVMTGQVVLIGNEVQSTGPNADFKFFDRDGGGNDAFTWFANAGLARLFPSALGADAIQIDELGNLFVHARIETNNTGASNKPLLNYVPLSSGNLTTVTGPTLGTVHSLVLTGVPASAVAVNLNASWLPLNSGNLSNNVASEVGQVNDIGFFTLDTRRSLSVNGILPILTTSTVFYAVTNTGAADPTDSFQVRVFGYYEPS